MYALERDGAPAATGDLASRLHVALSTVSGLVRRLAEQGLVTVAHYQGARLTEAGRRVALRTLRRHRIVESYLVTVLGYSWDRVHAEAERLEHAVSDALVERLAAALHDPRVDPHGAPIPTAEGIIDEVAYTSLEELELGSPARVVRVREEAPGLLRYLEDLGVRLGTEVVVIARAPFGGPISVRVVDATRLIGPRVASNVLVSSRRQAPPAR